MTHRRDRICGSASPNDGTVSVVGRVRETILIEVFLKSTCLSFSRSCCDPTFFRPSLFLFGTNSAVPRFGCAALTRLRLLGSIGSPLLGPRRTKGMASMFFFLSFAAHFKCNRLRCPNMRGTRSGATAEWKRKKSRQKAEMTLSFALVEDAMRKRFVHSLALKRVFSRDFRKERAQ